jgi:GT2 family glycosyltransferase
MAQRCVQRIQESPEASLISVIVVDNGGSGDRRDLAQRIEASSPSVQYLRAPSNLGYYGGACYGLEALGKTGREFDWVIVANVDVELLPVPIVRFLSEWARSEDVGLVAPAIVSSLSQMDLNPFMVVRPTRRRMRFHRLIHDSHWLSNAYGLARTGISLLARRLFTSRRQRHVAMLPQASSDGTQQPRDIYAAHGAFIAFSRLYFQRGGTLNFPGFLFLEEIFVAETARSANLRVVYDPRIRLRHDVHSSTGILRSRTMTRYMQESTDLVVDRFFP